MVNNACGSIIPSFQAGRSPLLGIWIFRLYSACVKTQMPFAIIWLINYGPLAIAYRSISLDLQALEW